MSLLPDTAMEQLVAGIQAADHRALARGITLIESKRTQAHRLLGLTHHRTGRAHVIGITGPPGAGKSTLVQWLAARIRRSGAKVAIVAIDPSSPFTGGALLGDRIRMEDGLADPSIFMRSLASRGKLGGLSSATADVVALLDAAGFNTVLVETVGAGQSEIEIMRLAQTTIVVGVPGLGDELQAEKSGILEIADIFVVNKADTDGAKRVATDLQRMLQLFHLGKPGRNIWAEDERWQERATSRFARRHLEERFGSPVPGGDTWFPPVIMTIASRDIGTDDLVEQLMAHRRFLGKTGRWESKIRNRYAEQIKQFVQELAVMNFFDRPRADGSFEALLDQVVARGITPFEAAKELIGSAK